MSGQLTRVPPLHAQILRPFHENKVGTTLIPSIKKICTKNRGNLAAGPDAKGRRARVLMPTDVRQSQQTPPRPRHARRLPAREAANLPTPGPGSGVDSRPAGPHAIRQPSTGQRWRGRRGRPPPSEPTPPPPAAAPPSAARRTAQRVGSLGRRQAARHVGGVVPAPPRPAPDPVDGVVLAFDVRPPRERPPPREGRINRTWPRKARRSARSSLRARPTPEGRGSPHP